MKQKNIYQKLEDELDKIILSEISSRIDGEHKNLSPDAINNILEKKNREIVEAHQQGNIASNLPLLFSGYLQTKEGGELYLSEKDLNSTEWENYIEKKGRLEVLFGASLNALHEPELKHIVNEKNRKFDEIYHKTNLALLLIQNALNIKEEADETEQFIPRDEEETVSYFREIAPLKARLQEIESRCTELREDNCISQALQKLQTTIHLASKSIESKSKRASEFIFNQATAVFQNYKSTIPDISNANRIMLQKEEIARYKRLFESIGDENRKNQTGEFISVIEKKLAHLQKNIEKQKEQESLISEKNSRKINEVYEEFLVIKENYGDGKIDTRSRKKKSALKLKKCSDILKSNGHRVKAREIEMFLNSTGLVNDKEPDSVESFRSRYIFYKRAFFSLLPFTLVLALISFYYIVIK